MSIKGLTTQENSLTFGNPDFQIFKGEKKQLKHCKDGRQRMIHGNDLEGRFRVEIDSLSARMLSSYSEHFNIEHGTLYATKLEIYLACHELEKTFFCSMQSYKGNKLSIVCDRDRIQFKGEMIEDIFRNKKWELTEVNMPCPLSDPDQNVVKCPHACKPYGELLFYLKPLLDKGMMMLGSLKTHSYWDIGNLHSKLTSYQKIFGNLKNPEILGVDFAKILKIPFILSRKPSNILRPCTDRSGKTTGQKALSENWGINIEVEPRWYRVYQQLEKAVAMQKMGLGFPLDPRACQALIDLDYAVIEQLGADNNDARAIEAKSLQALPSQKFAALPSSELPRASAILINVEQGERLRDLFRDRNWTRNEVINLLKRYGCDRLGQLTVQQYQEITETVSSDRIQF
jgi:hypothetical protein